MLTQHLAPRVAAFSVSEDQKLQSHKGLLYFYCHGLRLPHHVSRLLILLLLPHKERLRWDDNESLVGFGMKS